MAFRLEGLRIRDSGFRAVNGGNATYEHPCMHCGCNVPLCTSSATSIARLPIESRSSKKSGLGYQVSGSE